MRHSPGLEFPDDPERRSRSIPVLPGKVCFKEGQELVQGHTARTEVCTRVLGLQGPAELPQTRELFPPWPGSGHPRRLRCAPARWQPWSPRTTRAAGAPRVPRPRSEGLAGGLVGCSIRGAAVGTQAPGYRVQVTKGRGLLEAVQAPLPGTKWGPVPGSPSGGPRAWRLPECPTGWRALSALGHHGCTHRPGGAAWGGPARSCGVKYLVGSHPVILIWSLWR